MATGNTWNIRVVRHTEGEETFFTFHEAHYGEDKETPEAITNTPVYPQGETVEELAGELEKFREALGKPVIEFDAIEQVDDEVVPMAEVPPNPSTYFQRIEVVSGRPVAVFWSKIISIGEGGTGQESCIDRESLVRRIENARAAGFSSKEDERALKALDAAIEEWAQTPWDGK